MPFKDYEKLLALSYKPSSGASILDWCPFGGTNTLHDIVEEYNEGCFQRYSQLWGEGFAKMLTGIDVIPHDLSTVNTLKPEDFERIRFLLIDLDAIKKTRKEIIDFIRRQFDNQRKACYLLQVSTTPDAKPLISEFRPTFAVPFGPPLYPDMPEVINNIETFKEALISYCKLIGLMVNQQVTNLPE